MSKDTTALAPIDNQNRGLVRAAGNIVEALQEYQSIQAGLDKAMPEAIMKISGKQFRKKPYWRAIATAFNLDVRIIEEKQIGNYPADPDWGFAVVCRATAPNGRTADGDGSCFAVEKKRGRMEATYHNVRSHAHTRAFNRAVSNLVGFGEVSAEEAERDEQPDEPGSHDGPPPERGTSTERVISEPQRRRLYAISKKAQESAGMTDVEMKDAVSAILKKHGFDSSTEVTTDKYETICDEVAARGK